MSCNKLVVAALLLALSTASCAAQTHRYACPKVILEAPLKHSLRGAVVFDGPPADMASLRGGDTKDGVEFPFAKNKGDAYLVCSYEKTVKTITVHAAGVTLCRATQTAVYCD